MSEIISTSARLSLNTLSLTDSELQRVGKLIYKRAGIVVNAQKREMIFNRLSRRVRTLGLATFSDYIALLESHSEHPEWQNFINALTTNLTSFFREAYHFPILAEHARQRANGYRVWCTAASTGEEPCSIAMTLNDQLGVSGRTADLGVGYRHRGAGKSGSGHLPPERSGRADAGAKASLFSARGG